MKKVSLLIFLSVLLISCGGKEVLSTSFSPVDYVNPLVGTQSKFTLSTGNTYPAVALPWGMNFWTPQTGDMGNGWAYCYTDDKIKGFKPEHSFGRIRVFLICVKDEGSGIEDIEKAREPLFTTNTDGERSGMGFTVMESFMDHVTVRSEPGRGTEVIMTKNLDVGYEL